METSKITADEQMEINEMINEETPSEGIVNRIIYSVVKYCHGNTHIHIVLKKYLKNIYPLNNLMKTIGLKDLELVEQVVEEVIETKREPLFLGMKKKGIFRIEYSDTYIYGYNKDGKEVYFEDSNKFWSKREYKDGKEVYFEDSNKYWRKTEYKDGLEVYFENSDKYWSKTEYKNGKEVYFEDSNKFWRKREYKDGLQVYYEDSDKYWRKTENGKTIEYRDGKYTIDGKEAKLK